MPISVTCECGKTINVADKYAGRKGKCPACGNPVQVPAADIASEAALQEESDVSTVQPLAYAAPPMATGGPIAPPPSDVIRVPTELPMKLRSPGLPPCYLVISAEGADVNANFDAAPVLIKFAETFAKTLRKKYDVQLCPPADGTPAMVGFVKVIKVDQGNRWLRYFLGLLAGGTVFEIVGHVVPPGGQPAPFSLKHKARMGMFGGNSLNLLKLNARVLGKRVAKRVKKVSR